jgi:hypothetical protein
MSDPTTPPNPASHHLNRLQERKYFDSGDYAMCKAGQSASLGQLHPSPEAIPHASTGSVGRSPMKEQTSCESLAEEPELEEEFVKGGGFAQ